MKKSARVYKNGTILLLLVLCCNVSWTQLQQIETSKVQWTTVGEIKWLANTKASLKYFIAAKDTTYLLYMQDEQKLKNNRDITVRQYFSMSFSGEDNTLNKLYQLMISFFNKENRKDKQYEKTFRLGSELVIVRHFPKLTASAIVFATTKNSIVLTEKEVNKLFGR